MSTLAQQLADVQRQIDEVNEEIRPLEQQRMTLIDSRSKLRDLYAQECEAELVTFDAKMEFYLDVTKSEGSQKVYNLAQRFFYEHLKPLFASTYTPETNQRNFTITLHQNGSDLEEVAQAIEKVLPHLKPIQQVVHRRIDNSGCFGVRFDVLEHSAGDENSFTVFYDIENKEWIISSWWSRNLHRNNTVRGMLQDLIDVGGWYETDEEEDDDY